MNNIVKGDYITSPEGSGEVVEIIGDKAVIQLDSGGITTIAFSEFEKQAVEQTVIGDEAPEQTQARAQYASEIVARLDDTAEAQTTSTDTNTLSKQQKPMEISEKAIDVINDLIEINNDRIEGFQKAAADVEDLDSELPTVFNRLANESQNNVAELTDIIQRYGGEPTEGGSSLGALHRAWLDVKSVFTGGDVEAVLNECERGEDAIKAAYLSAIDPENELNPEVLQVLQIQQQGIVESHDLIKSLRDQATEDDNDEDEDEYQDEAIPAEPTYGSTPGVYGTQTATAYAPEPESIEQEEEWNVDQQATSASSSKLMEFFVDELKDLLWAEEELLDALPDMAEAATSQELKTAFTNHLAETQEHVSRLEQIFNILGLEPDTTKCDAMAGIVEEGDGIISNTEEGTAQRDVGLIFAGQKAEHYEIASYGGMVSLAKTLGYYDIAEILVLTLDEEKSADALLTDIAENHVNYEASIEPGDN